MNDGSPTSTGRGEQDHSPADAALPKRSQSQPRIRVLPRNLRSLQLPLQNRHQDSRILLLRTWHFFPQFSAFHREEQPESSVPHPCCHSERRPPRPPESKACLERCRMGTCFLNSVAMAGNRGPQPGPVQNGHLLCQLRGFAHKAGQHNYRPSQKRKLQPFCR